MPPSLKDRTSTRNLPSLMGASATPGLARTRRTTSIFRTPSNDASPTTHRRERRSSTHRPIGSSPRGSRRSSTSSPSRHGDRHHIPFFPGAGHARPRPSGWQAPRAAPHGHHQGPATSASGGGVEETLDQGCGNFGLQQHLDFPKEIVAGGGCPGPVLQGFYGRPRVSLRLGGSVFLVPAAGGSSSSASLSLSTARRRRRSSTSARNRTSQIWKRCPFSSTSWACPT